MLEQRSREAPRADDRCEVEWRGGQFLMAKVVDRRPLSNRKRKNDEQLPKTAVDTLEPDQIEYYVHYLEHDRRLDEWVRFDRFKIDTLQRHSNDDEIVPLQERLIRRRSSASLPGMSSSEGDPEQTASDFLSGGNWHGGSGDPTLAELEKEHEETTKVKNIEKIIMGNWEIEAWYMSPFPDEYSNLETLYVCEFCLTYMKKAKTYLKHVKSCNCRQPPGKEIYRESDIAVYELDGKDHKVYCQKLCLLAKLFLDHKTLYYDVNPFFFYIITKVDHDGSHIVGYFSKEKMSNEGYNLACILTFPQYQQSGYGKFIISLSYELTKREGKTGSPEKPLSDLGKTAYRSYWAYVLMNLLGDHDIKKNISINDISIQTGIKMEDIISTLQYLNLVKVWKGQHVVHVKQDFIRDYLKQQKQFRLCKSEYLKWEAPSERTSNPN